MKRTANFLDFAFLTIVIASTVGFALAQKGQAGVNQVIQGKARVDIGIYLVGFKTLDTELFKEGEKLNLTIRNQPVDRPMTITAVKHWPRQVAFLSPDGKKPLVFPDPTQPIAHDFLITITDEAERTRDGYVVCNNKIKIGNLIEVEALKYRVQGVVVDIRETQ